MNIVDIPSRATPGNEREGPHRSTRRVYGSDPNTGERVLLYPVGAQIPDEEARRQGLLDTPEAEPDPAAPSHGRQKARRPARDKAVKRPPEDKGSRDNEEEEES